MQLYELDNIIRLDTRRDDSLFATEPSNDMQGMPTKCQQKKIKTYFLSKISYVMLPYEWWVMKFTRLP